MSRRSKNKRRRERKRRKYQERISLQLPPTRTISTARIFELIELQTHILAGVLEVQSK